MSKARFTLNILAVAIFTLTVASMAQAQATRTWVSGVGDDVNPCSRTAPCKTFAGAISKTAAGGEIDCLDPGGFGTVTATKSITIDGTTGSGFGSILSSGVNGVNINDSATATPGTIVVKLRNLSINGAGTTLGINGVNFTSGATVFVESCRIMHFSGDGIRKATTPAGSAGRLIVQDTTITDCASDGIEMAGSNTANDAVSLEHVNITRCGNGVKVSNRASIAISNSVLSLNNLTGSSAAVISTSAAVGGAIIDLENTQVNFNSVGVQPNTNNAIRLSNVHMTGNGNALNFNGGTIGTYNNNRIFGNAAGENFVSLTDIQQQ
jgi:hypothetical protein